MKTSCLPARNFNEIPLFWQDEMVTNRQFLLHVQLFSSIKVFYSIIKKQSFKKIIPIFLKKSPSIYWKWKYNLSLESESTGSIEARLTEQTAEQLLQMTASEFAEHVKHTQEQVLESALAQECLFSISSFRGRHQIDAICLTS